MSYHMALSGTARPLVPPEAVPALLAVKDGYQGLLLIIAQVMLAMAAVPVVGFVFAPFFLLSVALNAIPYLLLALAIDSNISNTMKNEAAGALRSLDKWDGLQKLPGASIGLNVALVGQLGVMNSVARIFRVFLTPIARGLPPGPETIAETMTALKSLQGVQEAADLASLIDTIDALSGGAVYSKAVKERAAREQAAQRAKLEGDLQRRKPVAPKAPVRTVLTFERAPATVALLKPGAASAARPVEGSSAPLLLGAAALVGLFVLSRR